MTARVVAVIQARTSSERLPGKVLGRLGHRQVLERVVRAAAAAAEVDEVVVATSTDASDDAVAEAAGSYGATVVRGSLDDVLSRFRTAADETGADAVVRLTADCPMLDPALIDHVVALWRRQPELAYVSTTLVRSLPRGLDVELLTTEALRSLDGSATGHDRVHVTSALYAPGSLWPRAGLVFAPDASSFRITLDEPADAEALAAIVEEIGDEPVPWRDIVALLHRRPDICSMNVHVRQKELWQG